MTKCNTIVTILRMEEQSSEKKRKKTGLGKNEREIFETFG